MTMQVTDNRRVKDETVGVKAKVSTTTMKKREQDKVAPPKAKRPPKKSKAELEPTPFEVAASADPFDGLSFNGMWCAECGRPQYRTPSGPACKHGEHGGCVGLSWEEAARTLFGRGVRADETAERMEAELDDVVAYYAELRDDDCAVDAARLSAQAFAEERKKADEQTKTLPHNAWAAKHAQIAEDAWGCLVASAPGSDVEMMEAEAHDREQLQPVFKVGDRVAFIDGEDEDHDRGVVRYITDDGYVAVALDDVPDGGAFEARPDELRHLTEKGELVFAPPGPSGPPVDFVFEVDRNVKPENVPAPEDARGWRARIYNAELTDEDYAKLGRLWVASLAAGVSIDEMAKRTQVAEQHVRELLRR